MEHQALFQLIGNVLIHWAALVGVLSVIVHARVPWRLSHMGVHLMAYMAVFAVVMVLSCIRIWFGDSEWFALLRLITFIGVPVVMSWRLWLQVKAQRDA